MKDYSKIDIDDNRAVFDRRRDSSFFSNEISIFVILIVVVVLSLIVFFLEYFDNQYIKTLRSLVRIKKNMNSISKIVDESHSNAVRRTIMLKSLRPDLNLEEFECYDMGTYYVPARVNPDINTFEFIRRGKGSIHTIQKTNIRDVAALNYCQYLIQTQDQRDVISCGLDMYEKLGFSDLLQKNSTCNVIIEKLYKI